MKAKKKIKKSVKKSKKEPLSLKKEGLVEEIKEEGPLYVYGIVNNDIKLVINGLKDRPIQKINFKDISALVSIYPELNPLLKEREAMLHAEILQKIVQKATVIPMSYGAVFKNRKILERVLARSYQTLKNTLRLMENKIELGVKVVRGKLKENQLDDDFNDATKEILDSLNKLSVKSVIGDVFSEVLLLNYSFLVEKNKFSDFSEEIGALEKKYLNLKFIYTGPWPPYSFVNINIKAS